MFILFIFAILCFCFITIINRQEKFYFNNLNQFVFYSKSKDKLSYKKPCFFDIYENFKIIKKRKIELFSLKTVWENERFLKTLSKYIDYKIFSCNQKFRSKNNICYVEQVANFCSKQIILSEKCNVFETYKIIANSTKILQKEQKIFKTILAEFLFIRLFEIEKELSKIDEIINDSKTENIVINYKNKLHYCAQTYSVYMFNKNSTKLLQNKNIKGDIDFFISSLFVYERCIKKIVFYLKIMFD